VVEQRADSVLCSGMAARMASTTYPLSIPAMMSVLDDERTANSQEAVFAMALVSCDENGRTALLQVRATLGFPPIVGLVSMSVRVTRCSLNREKIILKAAGSCPCDIIICTGAQF